jgi:hypothetical protein
MYQEAFRPRGPRRKHGWATCLNNRVNRLEGDLKT